MRKPAIEEAGRWLDQAREDIKGARKLAEEGGYYIPTRYPNGLPDSIPAKVYNQKAASEAVALAGDVVDTVAELTGL